MFLGLPARHPTHREPARRPVRPGLALRVGRGSGARRLRGRAAARSRRTIELIILDHFSGTTVAGVHDAAGRGAAHPPRLRRHPVPSPSVRARTPARRPSPTTGCARSSSAPATRARRWRSSFERPHIRRHARRRLRRRRPRARRPFGARRARARHHRRPRDACASEHSIDRVLIALPDASREAIAGDRGTRAEDRRAGEGARRARPTRSAGRCCSSLRDLDLTDLLGREHAPVDPDRDRRLPRRRNGAGHRRRRLDRQRDRPPGRPLQPRPPAAPRPRREPPARDRQRRPRRRRSRSSPTSATRPRSATIFERYRPDVVFHAAAHKHVPILETPPGRSRADEPARHVVARAHRGRVRLRRFVHISTDKAAEPVLGDGRDASAPPSSSCFQVGSEHDLPFAAVRFGNVLGSRGSVVPTFFRQIVDGGPVTVTDPEMTRYFMTIPEAVSLVLQAGAMADEAQGVPARHGQAGVDHRARPPDDPPRRGYRPDEDIQIEIIGTPSRRAPARAAARRRRDRRADAAPVDLGRQPNVDARSRDAVLLPRAARDASAARRRPSPRSRSLLDQMLAALRHRVPARNSRARAPTTALAAPERAISPSTSPSAAIDAPTGRPRRRAPDRWPDRQLPALLGGAPRVRAVPPVRPPGPAAARAGDAARSSRRTTAACSRTARSSPSSRTASPSGSASRTSSRSARAPPGLMLDAAGAHRRAARPGRAAELHVLRVGARRHVERPHAPVRRVRPDYVPDRPRARGRAASTARAALLATHVFGAPCDPDERRCASRERTASRWCSTPRTRSARSPTAGRSAGSATPRCSASRPPRCSSPAKAGSSRPTTPRLAETLRIGRDYGNPGDYDTQFVGLERAHVGVPRGDGTRVARDVRRDARAAPPPRRALHASCLDERPRHPSSKRCPRSTRRRTRTSRSPSTPTSGSAATTSSSRWRPKASRPATTSIRRCTASRRTRTWTRPTSPSPTRLSASVLSLPIYPDLDDDHVVRVVDALATIHEYASELDDARNTFETRSPRTSSTAAPLNGHGSRPARWRELRRVGRSRRTGSTEISAKNAGRISDRCRTSSPMLPKDENATA